MALNDSSGIIKAHAGATAPNGYLLCDGASYLRSSYQSLFAVIGTTFGAADGTHFNVPDSRGRTLRGYDATDSNYNAIGKTGGAKTINIQHSHTMNNHTHTASGTSGTESATASNNSTDEASITNYPHTHSVSITTGAQNNTGSDNQLSETQTILNPFLTLNWIIKI